MGKLPPQIKTFTLPRFIFPEKVVQNIKGIFMHGLKNGIGPETIFRARRDILYHAKELEHGSSS